MALENNGKSKTAAIKKQIRDHKETTIVLNGDGTIKSVAGGGHSGPPMTAAEFDFEDFWLDTPDYGDEIFKEILDMKSMTVIIARVEDKKTKDKKIETYIWESSRHWW